MAGVLPLAPTFDTVGILAASVSILTLVAASLLLTGYALDTFLLEMDRQVAGAGA
ncbi:MAG: hypothetical protein ACYC6G_19840 [Desulfobaccales bacterium]